MTLQQKEFVKKVGLELKKTLKDFCGSVTYNFADKVEDIKIEIKEMSVAKANFIS